MRQQITRMHFNLGMTTRNTSIPYARAQTHRTALWHRAPRRTLWANRIGTSLRGESRCVSSQESQATRVFPKDELYGLTNQLRRAAVSVPSNIAEGQARFSTKEFHHFLSHSRGSLVEIETQLIIARSLGYLTATQTRCLLEQAAELGRIMNGLIASIKRSA